MDLITVIIPVYKVEPYLDRCVQSVIDQTYGNLEIILVDDGSPDGCPAICDAWAEKDDRVRVIHQKNGGLSAARNAGLDCMRGEYVAFVDSDDAVENTYIEKMHGAIKTAETKLALCGVCVIRSDEKPAPVAHDLPPVIDRVSVLRSIGGQSDINILFSVAWNKLYHFSLFSVLRFPVDRIHEDEFIMHHIFHQTPQIAVVPDALYRYYRRDDSIMGETQRRYDLDLERALLDRYRFLYKHYPQIDTKAYGELILRWADENRSAVTTQEQAEELTAFLREAADFHCQAQSLSKHDPSVSDYYMQALPKRSVQGAFYRARHKLKAGHSS